jgi:hypothetical protein
MIGGKDVEIRDSQYWVFGSDKHLETDAFRDIFREICNAFFAREDVREYPKWLAERKRAIRRNELLFYLYQLHPAALKAVFSVFAAHGLARPIGESDPLYSFFQSKVVNPDALTPADVPASEEAASVDSVFAFANNLIAQVRLAHKLRIGEREYSGNHIHVVSEFPERYLKASERIVHPPWAVACFVRDQQNASMWGHYAEGHKGMCLKFKTSEDENGAFLTLHGINGVGGAVGKPSQPLYGDVRLKFQPVKYQDRYPEIDFFRNMGRLPKPTLFDFWYRGENGEVSSCAGHTSSAEATAQWRDRYWDDFQSVVTTKLTDWSYEQELRLIRMETILDHYEVEHRKLKYQFKDLEGIIFGMKTSDAEKIVTMRIVEAKCKQNGRDDFKFYQAVYSQNLGKIQIVPMDGLRLLASLPAT